jgi:ATP-binding cassette subfamily B protein
LEEGKKLLVLGKTGSGKSTIAQLLLHFYKPTEGNIFIGKNNINNIPLQQLRDSISYVPQDVFLFSDMVANNIVFSDNGNSFSQENIQQVAEQAAVHKEILGFTKQYETVVGERGVTLSGGQKQRIAIARALIKQSNIIIFDDCLSAVDAKTEHLIANNLAQFLEDRTAVFITHRILTAFNFDKIIVLEDGMIIEEGTHETLLQQNGYYTKLYNLQLKEEVNNE